MTLRPRLPIASILPILIACVGALLSWWLSLAPRPIPESAPPEVFSAERAHRHIAAVCTAPQKIGICRRESPP